MQGLRSQGSLWPPPTGFPVATRRVQRGPTPTGRPVGRNPGEPPPGNPPLPGSEVNKVILYKVTLLKYGGAIFFV